MFGPALEQLLADVRRDRERREREEANRGWWAWMLAPTLEIYRALMAGESVPVESLDPEWVARLGLRP
jgi:hypothetical protein